MARPRILVVGGHSRNIGKTSLAVDLIRALPEAHWTAVRITQYGHNVCSANGHHCDCAPTEHSIALDEESNRDSGKDSSRFLAAGAARSLWLRTRQGAFQDVLPLLEAELKGAGNAIIESNTLLQFLNPVLYLMVLDPRKQDFKDSARRFLDRVDAFVLRSPMAHSSWPSVPTETIERKPRYLQLFGSPVPAELVDFVRLRFPAAA